MKESFEALTRIDQLQCLIHLATDPAVIAGLKAELNSLLGQFI